MAALLPCFDCRHGAKALEEIAAAYASHQRGERLSKDSDQTGTAPRKFKLGPLANLNQVTKGLAKTIRAMADGTLDSQALGALADRCPLVLGDSGEDVDGEPVGVRVVGGDELDVAVHQRGDEPRIAGQAVEFGDD